MISPIKIKIADRDYNMNASYGERKARVETVDGIYVVKKKEDILSTDRIISYISNDFVQPIKVKIVDLNIIYAFLLGAVARVAFRANIKKNEVFMLSIGKFISKIASFSKIDQALFEYYINPIASFSSKSESYDAFSQYTISANPTKLKIRFISKMTTLLSESYLSIDKIGIDIKKISDVIITAVSYLKIKDITQNTLEEDFFGDKTIDNLIESIQ